MKILGGRQSISRPALVFISAAGFLLLLALWRPNLHTLAAGSWLPVREPRTLAADRFDRTVFPAVQETSLGPHGEYGATSAACAGCHRTHTALGPDLIHEWPEENQCFACHQTAGGASTDMYTLFASFPSSSTAYYSHPVTAYSGVHTTPLSVWEEEGFERHVECTDCHNPHAISAAQQSAPYLSGLLQEVPGVEPVYAGSGVAAGFTWLPQAQYEYQLCFRCHSSYTVLPEYLPDGWNGAQVVADGLAKLTNPHPGQAPDSRDLSLEFNPFQTSYHPVLSLGRNQDIQPGSFVSGWHTGSYTYCSDCHATQMENFSSNGPHAGQLHILKESSPYVTANTGGRARQTGAEVCFNCHRKETYLSGADPLTNTNFRRNTRNLHRTHASNAACYSCHDSHGSEQRHLLNLDMSIDSQNPGMLVLLTGYDGVQTDSQTFWQISSDGATKTCFIRCHNQDHTQPGRTYPNYMAE